MMEQTRELKYMHSSNKSGHIQGNKIGWGIYWLGFLAYHCISLVYRSSKFLTPVYKENVVHSLKHIVVSTSTAPPKLALVDASVSKNPLMNYVGERTTLLTTLYCGGKCLVWGYMLYTLILHWKAEALSDCNATVSLEQGYV